MWQAIARLVPPILDTLISLRNANQLSLQKVTHSEIEEQRQQTQLKLEFLRIAHQQEQEQNRQAFQEKLALLGHQQVREIQEFVQSVNLAISQENLDFQRWRFEQEKNLQWELAAYNRETQFQLAAYQRETTLQSPEVNRIFENWPLRLYPSQILKSHSNDKLIPLRILISPPDVKFDKFSNIDQGSSIPKIENPLTEGLAQFLNQHYPHRSLDRPTEFLDGAWDSNRFYGGASIKALFGMLKSEPTLILESEVDGDYLNFRVAYWGLGHQLSESYCYERIISRLPYREILYKSAKARALKWKETRDKLLAMGRSPEEVNKLGGDNTINLKMLQDEEEFKQLDIDVSEIPFQYKVNNRDFEVFCQFLINSHCLIAGWVADIHHLFHHDVFPLLPQLLPSLTQDNYDPQIVRSLVLGYQEVCKIIATDRPDWVPELSLQLAQSLTHLPEKTWARGQISYSVKAWLQQRQVPQVESIKPLEAFKSVLVVEDRGYLDKLHECFTALGDKKGVAQVQELLTEIEELKRRELDEINRKKQQEAERRQKEEEERQRREFEFDIVIVDRQGREINRSRGKARQKIEDLGNGVSLEMVYIPGGTFLMGSQKGEGDADERPQHSVTVAPFHMGKYLVTQAQWKAVAAFPQINISLNADPSYFKGAKLPVENISWQEAVEFCARLSKKTGRNYKLPSEAQWEYACRAGTTTPFHFGETITPEIANYNGNDIYASGLKGIYRQQTTPVGSFPANAYGLYDMHGTLWEWCADPWHDNYNGAPSDGSVWESGGDKTYRLLHGGSWYANPRYCRSAYRDTNQPDARSISYGCRVVALS